MNKKLLILIMARKGSDDVISRQNLRLVKNKPLLYYIVKTALKFKKADVLVSTDSEEISELSLLYGANYIKRPKRLTKNSTSVKEICLDALQKLEKENIHYEKCLVLHPKIPLIKISTINTFFKNLEKKESTIFGISDIVDSMDRDSNHVYQYLLNELGTSGTREKVRVMFKGRVPPKRIKEKIVSYVKSYVICSQCRAPDTSFIKEARTTLLKCQACGATRPVRL